MRFGSVCSGIEAASMAWIPLGWRPVFFSEIEAFPCTLLKARHPGVPNFGDMTRFEEWPDAAIDVLVGGTPCQSFSVAGLRGGLDDARGNLMLTYAAIARRYRPKRLVWENVPGVLSSNGGRDFASLLGLLSGRAVIAPAEGWQNSGIVPGIESAYGLAWRVLDAQHFGVPQRRRRVFVVGCLGDWRRAAAVLFERASLRGDPAPSREKGQGVALPVTTRVDRGGEHREAHGNNLIANVAPTISARTKGGGGLGTDFDCDGGLIAAPHADISPALKARDGKGPSSDGDGDGAILVPMVPFAIQGAAGRENASSGPDGVGVRTDGVAYTLEARQEVQAVAFAQNQRDEVRQMDVAGALAGEPGMKQRAYIAFTAKDHGGDAMQDCSPTLRAGGFTESHANAGVMPAVAFAPEVAGTVVARSSRGGGQTNSPGHQADQQLIAGTIQVRRLTPRECERLQGFPDDYTLIPVRGAQKKLIDADHAAYLRRSYPDITDAEIRKLANDGPRYKALGNSMAVPVMRWIGDRIALVDAIPREVTPQRTLSSVLSPQSSEAAEV